MNEVSFVATDGGLNASIASIANSSTSDLYVRMSFSESYGYGAVGIGTKMAGSLIFVTYPSSDGTSEWNPSAIHAYGIGADGPGDRRDVEHSDSEVRLFFAAYQPHC